MTEAVALLSQAEAVDDCVSPAEVAEAKDIGHNLVPSSSPNIVCSSTDLQSRIPTVSVGLPAIQQAIAGPAEPPLELSEQIAVASRNRACCGWHKVPLNG